MPTPFDDDDDDRPEHESPAAGARLAVGMAAARNNFGLFYQLVIVLVASAVALAVVGGALSFLNVYLLILLTLGLAAVVAVKTYRQQQSQWWVAQGCCAACGYDLRGLPTSVCPECGRDSAVDEPTWRRLRREHEAKFGRTPVAAETDAAAALDEAAIRRLLAKAEQRTMDL